MPTIFQEIQKYLTSLKARGTTRVWISPENLEALYKITASPAAVPAQRKNSMAPMTPPARGTMPMQQTASHATTQDFRPIQTPPSPPPRMSVMASYDRQAHPSQPSISPAADASRLDWDGLCAATQSCRACRLYAGRKNVVFEDGCRRARVMFIGEGPGVEEDIQGKPFVGRAGQLLSKMILAMGLNRDSADPATGAYIANIVKCHPPQNRNPLPDEGHVCIGFLKRQIELVSPEVIILLGAVPLSFLLGKTGIMRLRGQWLDYGGIPVMPTFHPSYLLRLESRGQDIVREEKRKVWQDLQLVMARLGLKRPQ